MDPSRIGRAEERLSFLEDRIERMTFLLSCALDVTTRAQLQQGLRDLRRTHQRLARREELLEIA